LMVFVGKSTGLGFQKKKWFNGSIAPGVDVETSRMFEWYIARFRRLSTCSLC
jgi:hypothetical protein